MNFLQVSRRLLTCAVVAVSALVANGTHAQGTDDKKPVVSDKPLTEEQLAVYRVVLKRYLSDDAGALNLSIQTVLVESEGPFGGHDCSKGILMEPPQSKVVHLFRSDDLARLGFPALHLVDPDQQGKILKANDPGKAIRNGVPVDDAVKNGFSNALFSLSEVWFDKTHRPAIVSYRFWCGSLCGNGASVVVVKKGESWSVQTQCGGWIS
jgi:hypothetical protein